MELKKNQIKLSEYDSNKDYHEGTEFVWDDELDVSEFDIPDFLKDKDDKGPMTLEAILETLDLVGDMSDDELLTFDRRVDLYWEKALLNEKRILWKDGRLEMLWMIVRGIKKMIELTDRTLPEAVAHPGLFVLHPSSSGGIISVRTFFSFSR
jgi:hypothetical protein